METADVLEEFKQHSLQQLCSWGWWCWIGDSEGEEISFGVRRLKPAAASPQVGISP